MFGAQFDFILDYKNKNILQEVHPYTLGANGHYTLVSLHKFIIRPMKDILSFWPPKGPTSVNSVSKIIHRYQET